MATVINNPPGVSEPAGNNNALLGVILVILVILILWLVGAPFLRGARGGAGGGSGAGTVQNNVQQPAAPAASGGGTNINVPGKIDVNVKGVPGASGK